MLYSDYPWHTWTADAQYFLDRSETRRDGLALWFADVETSNGSRDDE